MVDLAKSMMTVYEKCFFSNQKLDNFRQAIGHFDAEHLNHHSKFICSIGYIKVHVF